MVCRMATGTKRRKRQRGEIEELPSGSLRVKVYAGVDPISGRRHYLTETISPGPNAYSEAEKARTRLLAQVDDRRNPRTRATLDQLLDRWLEVVELEATTRMGYQNKLRKHVRPVLGKLPVGRIEAETLESFYAGLRRCRDWCGGRRYVEHRTSADHTCNAKCRPHTCKPLAASTVRQIHWILSGALSRAVRWRWIAVNMQAPAGVGGGGQPRVASTRRIVAASTLRSRASATSSAAGVPAPGGRRGCGSCRAPRRRRRPASPPAARAAWRG
jgi:hypothetical protein